MSTHKQRLLIWFERSATITPLQAWRQLGIQRLSGRILDLRQAGHSIETEMIEVATAHGDVARVARYSYLGGPERG